MMYYQRWVQDSLPPPPPSPQCLCGYSKQTLLPMSSLAESYIKKHTKSSRELGYTSDTNGNSVLCVGGGGGGVQPSGRGEGTLRICMQYDCPSPLLMINPAQTSPLVKPHKRPLSPFQGDRQQLPQVLRRPHNTRGRVRNTADREG